MLVLKLQLPVQSREARASRTGFSRKAGVQPTELAQKYNLINFVEFEL